MMSSTRFDRQRSDLQAHCEAAVLAEARSICQAGLSDNADDAMLLHLRGILASREGRNEFAIACLTRSLAINPTDAKCRVALGGMLERSARLSEALQEYESALALVPHDIATLCCVGRTLMSCNRTAEAMETFAAALRTDPDCAQVHLELGDAFRLLDQRATAISHYRRSIHLQPRTADGYIRLGRTYLHERMWSHSLETFREGLQLLPAQVGLHIGAGEALLRSGGFEAAAEAFRVALSITPRDVTACRFLIFALELLGRHGDAVDAWCTLGSALRDLDRVSEAAAAYEAALARRPQCLRALVEAGTTCLQLSQPEKASAYFEDALAVEPEHPAAHQRLGWAQAHLGNLQRHWEEVYWIDRHGPWKRFEQPAWSGFGIEGKTILLWINAGLGDMIQHLRFVPLVKSLGARVIVECRPALLSLVARLDGVDLAIATGTPLPQFDTHALMATVPRLLRIGWNNIPHSVPYVHVDPSFEQAQRLRLGPSRGRAIGLVWASGDIGNASRRRPPIASLRSAPLAAFASLADISKLRFISLQLGPRSDELLAPPTGLCVESCLEPTSTVMETAALIQCLDLVITVDTMVAHLAGALGKPVWTLLPYAPAWMWRTHGENSEWYPSMRLFRQERPGDWRGPIERVRQELLEMRT